MGGFFGSPQAARSADSAEALVCRIIVFGDDAEYPWAFGFFSLPPYLSYEILQPVFQSRIVGFSPLEEDIFAGWNAAGFALLHGKRTPQGRTGIPVIHDYIVGIEGQDAFIRKRGTEVEAQETGIAHGWILKDFSLLFKPCRNRRRRNPVFSGYLEIVPV